MFMNKKYFLVTVAALVAISLNAQKLRVSTDTVKYGTLFKYVTSSVNVTIFNDAPLDMAGVKLTTTNIDFTVSDSVINIPAKSSKQVSVKFRPRHNVDYDEELVITTQSPYGASNVHLKGTGYYAGSYYTTTQNKWEGDLLTELKNKIANASTLGYTNVRDQMYATVDNFNDTITCVYTGRKAVFNTRAGAVTNNFTAEHTFPRSKYTSTDPMFSDIHHLFPADGPANTRRSDDPYGIVTSPVWMEGGSMSDNQQFEPRDYHKGTAARALFYFVTRYQDYTGFFNPQEDLMRVWAAKYKVNSMDSLRHEKAAGVQGNRNPFTDHPEFIERISNFAGPAPSPVKQYTLTYTNPVNIGYVPFKDTVKHGVVIVNTGNAALDFNLTELNPKPQPNFTTATGAFTLQPRQARKIFFTFIGKTAGTNYTDSFTLTVQGVNAPVLAFNASVSGLSAGEVQRTNISMYPNPATNFTSINADKALNYPCAANFYDISGKLVYSTVLNESFTELNLQSLAAGCYFVQVNDGALSSFSKLVKY